MSAIENYAAQLDSVMQEKLRPWLEHILLKRQDDSDISGIDQPRLNGWQAYYQNDYLLAHQYFTNAIQQADWQQFLPDTALGLAKVYTRTGHWHTARNWCLYYLNIARQALYHFDIAKGYGALAEIFLRANYPKSTGLFSACLPSYAYRTRATSETI